MRELREYEIVRLIAQAPESSYHGPPMWTSGPDPEGIPTIRVWWTRPWSNREVAVEVRPGRTTVEVAHHTKGEDRLSMLVPIGGSLTLVDVLRRALDWLPTGVPSHQFVPGTGRDPRSRGG